MYCSPLLLEFFHQVTEIDRATSGREPPARPADCGRRRQT